MSDYFEIDFLKIDSNNSGDAITLRYLKDDIVRIHVVDAGYKKTGESVIEHLNQYYDKPTKIDAVVVTHPDGDHAGGIIQILEEYEVGQLWMLRPWEYANELISRFSRFTNVENLADRLKKIYSTIAEIEKVANDKNIQIKAPFQGSIIGDFIVCAPLKSRYLDLIVESEKTPEAAKDMDESLLKSLGLTLEKVAAKVISFVKALWGEEVFSPQETSPENEMSVVQFALLTDKKILLTGDAGRSALAETATFLNGIGIRLPGIDRIQVPHHGSRRNVSTEVLDMLLGERLEEKPDNTSSGFTAIISASEDDKDHPRNSVIRAFYHRGARSVTSTEKNGLRTSMNAPKREGWVTATPIPYPNEQEKV